MKFLFNRLENAPVDYWLTREYLLTNGAGGLACGTLADCLQPGRHQVCAGYVMYGSSTGAPCT